MLQVLESAELVGFFVSPQVYCKLILPSIQTASSPSVLMTCAAIIRGTQQHILQPHLAEICDTLILPEVCCGEQVSSRFLSSNVYIFFLEGDKKDG